MVASGGVCEDEEGWLGGDWDVGADGASEDGVAVMLKGFTRSAVFKGATVR